MGYFRIFYYIAYIFNTISRLFRRHGKQILWVACIFGFLIFCMWPSKSHAIYMGDDTYTDPNNTINLAYDDLCMNFLRRFDRARNSSDPNVVSACELFLNRYINYGTDVYLYYTTSGTNDFGLSMINGSPLRPEYIYALLVPTANGNFSISPSAYDNYLGVDCNVLSVKFTGNTNTNLLFRMNSGTTVNFQASTLNTDNTFYIPSILFHSTNKYIYDYFFNSKSLEEIELLYEMNNKLDSIEDTMTELPTENSITSDELPTDSGVDTTDLDNGLNGLFGQIAEAFTDIPRSKYNITVPVPFTNKSFVIPYNLTSSALSDSNFSWVTSIISAFWYYVVGRYILIDIINKFEHIQSGNIENMENDNIKEDLL